MEVKLECSECGAPGTGSCECGAPYVKRKQKMLDMIRTNPGLSDYVIAKESGVGRSTVQRARFDTSPLGYPVMSDNELNSLPQGQPVFRTGRDGNLYKAYVKELSPLSPGEKLSNELSNSFHRFKAKLYKQLKDGTLDQFDQKIMMEKILEIALEFRVLAQVLMETNTRAHEEEDVEVD